MDLPFSGGIGNAVLGCPEMTGAFELLEVSVELQALINTTEQSNEPNTHTRITFMTLMQVYPSVFILSLACDGNLLCMILR
jgi:hypothetical protein